MRRASLTLAKKGRPLAHGVTKPSIEGYPTKKVIDIGRDKS